MRELSVILKMRATGLTSRVQSEPVRNATHARPVPSNDLRMFRPRRRRQRTAAWDDPFFFLPRIGNSSKSLPKILWIKNRLCRRPGFGFLKERFCFESNNNCFRLAPSVCHPVLWCLRYYLHQKARQIRDPTAVVFCSPLSAIAMTLYYITSIRQLLLRARSRISALAPFRCAIYSLRIRIA